MAMPPSPSPCNFLLCKGAPLSQSNMFSFYYAVIFDAVSEDWGQVDVGVIVCGPTTLESSVAKEIRSHNLNRQSHYPMFHFHTHSFDL